MSDTMVREDPGPWAKCVACGHSHDTHDMPPGESCSDCDCPAFLASKQETPQED